MNKDYRNTGNCPMLCNVGSKKEALEDQMRTEHPKTKIMYNLLHNKQGPYFAQFSQIYNHKCAYCGALIGLSDIRLFEVDHFICEASFENSTSGRSEAGRVSNLVLSCYSCNRGKGNLKIDEAHSRALNPDDGSINSVFLRDKNYYIGIQPGCLDDPFILEFYQKLLLGSEFRRLDYLLLEMKNFTESQEIHNPVLSGKLQKCLNTLLLRRNKTLI